MSWCVRLRRMILGCWAVNIRAKWLSSRMPLMCVPTPPDLLTSPVNAPRARELFFHAFNSPRAFALIAALVAVIPIAAQSTAPAQAEETLARAYADDPSARARAALIDYGSHHKDVSGALALLAVGAADTRENRDQDALVHLKKAKDHLPALDDYIAFLTATAHYDLNDDEAAIHALEPVWTHSPKSPLLAR